MFRPIALALSLTIAALPATAGSLEYLWTPRTQQESAAVEVGMLAYAIARTVRNRADVNQNGSALAALIRQRGTGNLALIDQRGSDQSAAITQTGRNNAFAVIQRGRGTSADITQTGRGAAGFLFQYGW